MKGLCAIMFFITASLAQANTVAIASGEHATFSRLVLSLPAESDWQLGRTATGYELTIAQSDLRYDVSKVFDLIPRTRLSGLFTDPRSGNLQLTIDCACHAMPFSLDARTLVIDLRDGPPPATSSFELTLQGGALPALQDKVTQRPRPRQIPRGIVDRPAYDWLSETASIPVLAPSILPVLPAENLADLQQSLVEQLADGAARGVVDLALPAQARPNTVPLPAAVQVRLTDVVGLRVATGRPAAEAMQEDGQSCLADERLNIAVWGEATYIAGQMARARMDLVGEFDVPRGDAVAVQARLYLYLGFGAEAVAILNAMPPGDSDVPLWIAIAQVIDGNPVVPAVFDGMAQCDSNAALWATLAAPADDLNLPNLPAVQRAFSALPRHLRIALGPQITDRLLTLDQPAAAQAIIDAMARGTATVDTETLLAGADLDLHTGAVDAAVSKAETALGDGGVSAPAALIALVRAKIAANEGVAPDVAVALAAMKEEFADHPMAEDLAAALQLALIGSGQFAEALSQAAGPVPPAFWDAIAERGTDDDLLQFAFEAPQTAVPVATADKIAERLQTLGFAEAAMDWHRHAAAMPTMQTEHGTDTALIADAEAQADAAGSEVTIPDDAMRAQRWQQDWAAVAASEGDPWRDLAATVAGAEAASVPPLAAATRLVQDSKTTRDLIDGLLQRAAQPGG
jgi:hypothetical protein